MFESVISNELNSFLEMRKAVVSESTAANEKTALNSLDRHLAKCDYNNKVLSEDILESWVRSLGGKSKTVHLKVITIRTFVKYLNGMGNLSFMPYAPNMKSDYIPYIFSDEELLMLIHYADNLEIKSHKSSSPYIAAKIPMLLRILYGCGTRLGETLALRRKDIDFKNRTVFLCKTKGEKERLIPVHDTLMSILEQYCFALGIILLPDAYLFPGAKHKNGRHLTKRQAAYWFAEILRLANIDQRKKNLKERGACLHCLRHVFVLKSMQQLESAGRSVDMNDLLLPTYLGHENLLDTDKYMRFSGVQLPETLTAFETFTSGLIPKVEVPYED